MKLIGDPCYRYNKEAKEKFFKNPYLAYMFLYFALNFGKRFISKKASVRDSLDKNFDLGKE